MTQNLKRNLIGGGQPASARPARLEWVDALKGILIFLVVYGHALNITFGFKPFSYRVIYSFHMPAFFVLSGMFAFRAKVDWPWLRRQIPLRAKLLLLPTLIVGLILCTIFLSTVDLFFDYYHGGYWFTITLFECTLLLSLVLFAVRRWGRVAATIATLALMVAIYFLRHLLFGHFDWQGPAWSRFLSIVFILLYMRFFAFGYLLSLWCPWLKRHWASRMLNTRFGRWLQTLGRCSLQVYLLHYFLLRSLRFLQSTPIDRLIQDSFLAELPIVGALSAAVCVLCVAFARWMERWPKVKRLAIG